MNICGDPTQITLTKGKKYEHGIQRNRWTRDRNCCGSQPSTTRKNCQSASRTTQESLTVGDLMTAFAGLLLLTTIARNISGVRDVLSLMDHGVQPDEVLTPRDRKDMQRYMQNAAFRHRIEAIREEYREREKR